MRVIKDADVRKNEILDAATILFAEKGADHTSVADIMTAVGIAKGTLYHHFKSKEEIMDALIERQTSVLLKKAKMAAGDQSMPVNERMLRTVLALHMDTEQTEEGNDTASARASKCTHAREDKAGYLQTGACHNGRHCRGRNRARHF